jgi:hypothetical protein
LRTFKIAVGCSTTANSFCHCVPVKAGDEEMSDGVTVHNGIAYANHDGVELAGDLYLPKAANTAAKAAPALVAVHGGGWVAGVRAAFQYWGPYLAARGIAVFAISYRLTTKSKAFPEAVQDVLAGVQFVRGAPSASIRHGSGSLARQPVRIWRRWRRSAARNFSAPTRTIHSQQLTPALKR